MNNPVKLALTARTSISPFEADGGKSSVPKWGATVPSPSLPRFTRRAAFLTGPRVPNRVTIRQYKTILCHDCWRPHSHDIVVSYVNSHQKVYGRWQKRAPGERRPDDNSAEHRRTRWSSGETQVATISPSSRRTRACSAHRSIRCHFQNSCRTNEITFNPVNEPTEIAGHAFIMIEASRFQMVFRVIDDQRTRSNVPYSSFNYPFIDSPLF
jgi:hypothetical protein